MSKGLLAGKKGIIFGALDSQSIAWKVAELAHEEGAKLLLTNAPIALRMGQLKELAAAVNAEIIPADATNQEELNHLFTHAKTAMGGVDFVLHSIGMSPNVRKGKHYTALDYDLYHKTLDISAMSFHRVMRAADEAAALNAEASVLALSYIAAQRTFPDYGDMADAKALLESIARSYGYHLGKKNRIRVNTLSQSPTKTTAGQGVKGFGDFFDFADKMSPLGNASAEDCASYCLALFSDYTKAVTMQNLFHDGGFSSMGVSEEVLSA